MQHSGFVLAGGSSSRMGRDKALLPYRGATLLEHIAAAVHEAAGSVSLIGAPERYRHLGYPVYPDQVPGCGPLGGICTALSASTADWNVVVACDMPGVSVRLLRDMLARASESTRNCVAAAGPAGEPEPLCAVYHRRCLPVLLRARDERRLRLRDLMPELDAETRPVEPALIANVNTPAEWAWLEKEAG